MPELLPAKQAPQTVEPGAENVPTKLVHVMYFDAHPVAVIGVHTNLHAGDPNTINDKAETCKQDKDSLVKCDDRSLVLAIEDIRSLAHESSAFGETIHIHSHCSDDLEPMI